MLVILAIKKIPESIGDLTNLTYLSLESNLIKKMPSSLEDLTQLKFLYLGKNLIDFEEQERILDMVPEGCVVVF